MKTRKCQKLNVQWLVLCCLIGLIGGLLLPAPSQAANLTWTNTASSGNYTDANNWNPVQVPGAGAVDATIFTNDAAYTVNFTADATLATNYFNGHTGVVTVDITGHTWTLTAPSGGNGTFVVGELGNNTATVYLAGGTLAVTNATANALLIVEESGGAGTFNVTNGTVIADLTRVGALTTSGQGTLTISGNGTAWTNNGAFIVGNVSSRNTLIVSNGASLVSGGLVTIGNNNTASNTASVLSGGTWNLHNQALYIGSGIATGNAVVINGGVVTNVGFIDIGHITANLTFAFGNSLTISNGGQLYSGNVSNGSSAVTGSSGNSYNVGGFGTRSTVSNGLIVIGNDGSLNTMTVTNAELWSSGGLIIGANTAGTNNTVTVNSNATWNLLGGSISLRQVNNSLAINQGGIITNAGAVNVGNQGAATGNALTVSNGARFFSGAVTVGNGTVVPGNNLYSVGGGANAVTVSNGALTVGINGNSANTLTVTNAAFWTGLVTVGNLSSNNTVTVLANTTWTILSNAFTIGVNTAGLNSVTINAGTISGGGGGLAVVLGTNNAAAGGNALVVTNGGQLLVSSVTAGFNAGSNSVLVVDRGLLEANALVAGNFTGNTISNVGGIYQFTTNAPTITPNGAGRIALTGGTISFRGIDTADVTSSLGNGALKGIAFAGTNTFMLNAATNTTASQTYTFDVVAGGPSNYVNLTLINGQTAYRGGNVTIGNNGTLLVTNTTASIPGVLTNSGTVILASGSLTVGTNLVLTGGSVLQQALGTTPATLSSSNVTLSGTSTLNVMDAGGFTNTTYTLITYTGSLLGGGTLTVGANPNPSFTYAVNTNTTGLVLLSVTGGGGPTDPFATWQSQYFTGGSGNPAAAGNADPLGKGISNTNQFLAGFNPTNSAAYPHILSVAKSGADEQITYLGANGDTSYPSGPTTRTNVLEYTTGTATGSYSNDFASTGQTNILTGGTGSGIVTNMVDAGGATNVPSRFYRVRVLVP